MTAEKKFELLLDRVDGLLDRLDGMLPSSPGDEDPGEALAYRWCSRNGGGHLAPVHRPSSIRTDDLYGIDRQKAELERNTHQFVTGRPANNALLWGTRGTGKSSLIKAMLNSFSQDGLRLVEMERLDVMDLPRILDMLAHRLERYILFCDDLSFEAGDAAYKALKVALDGSLTEVPENVLVYATSNRRHMLPEYMGDNLEAQVLGGEIHHSDAVEERISLSERFGLWLSFYPFSQDTYLEVVHAWLVQLGYANGMQDEVNEAALRWALERGSRSGRSAWQFAKDWVGRKGF